MLQFLSDRYLSTGNPGNSVTQRDIMKTAHSTMFSESKYQSRIIYLALKRHH